MMLEFSFEIVCNNLERARIVWGLNDWNELHQCSFLTSATDFLPALRQVPVFPMLWGQILSPGIEVLLEHKFNIDIPTRHVCSSTEVF